MALILTSDDDSSLDSEDVVETSVTNNSLSKDYPHPDDHTIIPTNTNNFICTHAKQITTYN